MWQYNNTDELYHYGVKGMRWGVRRAEKNAGSYTRKGINKFKESSDAYDSAKKKFDQAKQSKDKVAIKSTKRDLKSAKSRMNKDYKQIKLDKKADEGRRLYMKGNTVTGNYFKNAAAQSAIVLGTACVNRIISRSTGNPRLAAISTTAIAVGGTAVNAILTGKTMSNNRKLRAYYAHNR